MLRSHLLFVLCFSVWSCGRHVQDKADAHTPSNDSVPALSLPLAKYPTDMPQSPVGDRRLIGYWVTVCQPLGSGSGLWSFLLDPTKAVLEAQLYQDDDCLKPTHIGRSYMTFTADGTTLDAKIWQVNTTIHDRTKVAPSQDCDFSLVEDDSWYDFTGSSCHLSNLPVVTNKGATLIHSNYFIDAARRGLRFEMPGQGSLQFSRQD